MHGHGWFFLFPLAVPSIVKVGALHAVPKEAQRQQSLLVEARTQPLPTIEKGKVSHQSCGLQPALWFTSIITHDGDLQLFPIQSGETISHFWI